MEIVLGLVVLVVIVIFIGKMKGAPLPKEMSGEAIMGRLNSENAWIRRFQTLDNPGDGLKRQHDEKQRYIMELMLELKTRHGNKEEESLAPVMQRAYELIRKGVSEEKAKEQAIAEYVASRDARQAADKGKEGQQS